MTNYEKKLEDVTEAGRRVLEAATRLKAGEDVNGFEAMYVFDDIKTVVEFLDKDALALVDEIKALLD